MLKKLARAAVRRTRRWLEEEPEKITDHNQERFLPQRLSRLCLNILAQDSRRPNYVWGVVHAVALAQALGIRHASVIEFGVAGGNGLIALQEIAARVEELFRTAIDVYGFDSGVGLPKPKDYRDLPNIFSEGFYPMDVEKLRQHLKKAKLILGRVEDTVPEFINSTPAPVAFVAIDLDLYTATKHALSLFAADQKLLLPRIFCYFDDILGYPYNEFTGELLAISEFNTSHEMRKISKLNGLRCFVPSTYSTDGWVEQFYMAHIFDHELYGHYDGMNPPTPLDLILKE